MNYWKWPFFLLFPHSRKGLIHHVVQNFNNYNLSFRKLGINTVQMRPVSACYTSGRGRLIFLGLGHDTTSEIMQGAWRARYQVERSQGWENKLIIDLFGSCYLYLNCHWHWTWYVIVSITCLWVVSHSVDINHWCSQSCTMFNANGS